MIISQREARRLKKRVTELEGILADQRYRWANEWPSGIVIGRFEPNTATMAQVETARALRHAVIAVPQNGKIALFADHISSK